MDNKWSVKFAYYNNGKEWWAVRRQNEAGFTEQHGKCTPNKEEAELLARQLNEAAEPDPVLEYNDFDGVINYAFDPKPYEEFMQKWTNSILEFSRGLSEAVEVFQKTSKMIQDASCCVFEEEPETSEPQFKRLPVDRWYSYVNYDHIEGFHVSQGTELPDDYVQQRQENNFAFNNYFYTRERAQEVVDRIKHLMLLERMHDTYCPDYKPDWNNHWELKYRVLYDNGWKCWITISDRSLSSGCEVYFPKDIAQKVCEILNGEDKNDEQSK